MALELLVEIFAKVRFSAQGLEDKNTHANEALSRRIITLVDGVEEDQHDEVMSSVRIDDECSETLVALQRLQK